MSNGKSPVNAFKKALTQDDDETWDYGALTVAFSILALAVFQGFSLSTFSAVSFGGGVAAILTAGGAQLLMRKRSDQQPAQAASPVNIEQANVDNKQ